MKRIPETITEEELIKIITSIKKPKKRLAYLLGFYQAMRISEIVKLSSEHIDLGRKIIRIKSGKGNKDRNIPISPEVIRGLRHLPIGTGVRALEISFKKACKKVLDRDLYFHCLRHSGATFYLNVKKWNLRQVQNLLGHSSVQTTQIYTEVTPEDLVNAMWAGVRL